MGIKGLRYMLDYEGSRGHLHWVKNNYTFEMDTASLFKTLRNQFSIFFWVQKTHSIHYVFPQSKTFFINIHLHPY